MKKIVLFTLLAVAISTGAYAQFSEFTDNPGAFTLSSDNNTLQIGGRLSFYYENRILKAGQDNLKHNGFGIKDADLDILGHTSSKFVYEVHMSIVDLATAAATQNTNNPANPGIKAAYIGYNGFKIHIKFGYDKLPYSQDNISAEHETPFWGRPVLTGGDLFSRRDLGITLNTKLYKNRFNLYAGAYTGMGENFFQYGTDESGTFEYVGRAEFSYPSKMPYHVIDEDNSSIFRFRVAANARYENKTQPNSATVLSLYPDEPGAYDTRMITGKRTVYGGDALVMYKGISATFETDLLNLKPSSPTDPLFNGTPASFNKGVVNAGGIITSLNYNWQQIRSVFSVGYENTNTNDLIAGNQEWVNVAYAYKFNGFNSCAKIEYYIPTKEDVNSNPLKYTGQLRVGYQVVF